MDDFYDLLEVPEDATQADVKRAWREKAREYHPDVNDDARASGQFKTLRVAYEVLSDETKREAYDRMGHATYVNRRLDGLPTTGVPTESDAARGGRWDDSSRNARGGSATSNRSRSTGSSTNRTGSSSRSRSRTGATNGSSSNQSSSRRNSSRQSSSRRNSSNQSASHRSSSSGSSAHRNASRQSSSRRSSGGRAESGRTHAEAASPQEGDADAGFVPANLKRRWYTFLAVFLAGLAYLGGLAVYLRANADSVSAFAAAARTAPRTAVTADYGLSPPGAFALAAADADPGLALAFPAATVLLAVVFLVVLREMPSVNRWRNYYLYLYPLAGLLPLASLALGTVVTAGATSLSLALVLLPLVSTTAYLADLGWYLVERWR
ncbi:DnaJ domain-containing protein [Halogeometricum rufum]|uniref:DnaJ domain-containing protein n=1 Tax=Halogeometricum rufum TaxID=553469 RepID=A0A1I6GLD3_9EURY|nr:DnaJ domain-containing protein [Halogeometricum rufum]SFR43032.1 DnaJ domain-containing protein [Halogeometricum rufum]